MNIKIGEWTIDIEDGYFSVSFPMGEHDCNVFYSANDKDGKKFVQVDIDQKKLARIDLPEGGVTGAS